jgi:hypothetical protein
VSLSVARLAAPRVRARVGSTSIDIGGRDLGRNEFVVDSSAVRDLTAS